LKSDVSYHLELMQAVYKDACVKCTAEVSDLRDMMTIMSRVENEGLSFLTITLPRFCKDFERSLAAGGIDSTYFREFRKCGAIPAFLQGMLSRIFNRETGRISNEDEIDPTLVESVRQVCLLFKKVEMPCTPERDEAAIENFIRVEQSFCDFRPRISDICVFANVANVLWSNALGDLRLDSLVPRHGPGATAERISGNQKYVWREWHERLEPYFPFLPLGYTLGSYGSSEFETVTFVPEHSESPVRVTLVPKTLNGPRIIAIEPVCMQYAQQAVLSELVARIERHWLSRGHVNFSDQKINQDLALIASKDGRMATIDLKDASDRVPRDLALSMFDCNPELREAINACRSTRALLPDGRVIGPLSKFASMGSALCFPVEAMYFYTICVMALLDKCNLPISLENIYNVSREIYVYGDDIIVPVDAVDAVLDYLQRFNCEVNSAKSFWTGRFRESCGTDAYNGYEVTPVYLRSIRPENRQQASELISWVATANLFYMKGYWRTASLMFSTCERILGDLPYVSPESAGLGRISVMGYRSADRWCDRYQRLEVRAWVAQPVYRCDRIDGYPALHKSLLLLERGELSPEALRLREGDLENRLMFDQMAPLNEPLRDVHQLERTVRLGAVTLKRRGVPTT
jgi:hypothetical protein